MENCCAFVGISLGNGENQMAALREKYEARALSQAVDAQAEPAIGEMTAADGAEFFGLDKTEYFEDFRKKYLEVSKMAADSDKINDWSATKPRVFTDEEKADVIAYAESKGIKIGSLNKFDGDPDLFKAEIDTIIEESKEYGISKQIVLSAGILDDADFAQSHEYRITINTKALRNRAETERNMVNVYGKFSERTVEDISRHEIGHVISFEHGNIGLEIARKHIIIPIKRKLIILN